MRFSRVLRAGAVAAAAVLALAACDSSNEASGRDVGSGGGGLGDGGAETLTIGIKFDQPGLGEKTPCCYKGFDVDVATYIANELGFEGADIRWVESPSSDREDLLKKGTVDLVVATYSITDERKAEVDFAGPYFIAHQDLLVRANDSTIKGPQSLNGKKLCAVKGSTSAQKVQDEFAEDVDLREYGGYAECVAGLDSGAVDAVTTDDAILAGLAAANGAKFKLVGESLSDEKYGVGLKKGNTQLRADVNAAIEKMVDDGTWARAVQKHFGAPGFETPEPPQITEK
jgi:glutamate transport system substrate-binding protein